MVMESGKIQQQGEAQPSPGVGGARAQAFRRLFQRSSYVAMLLDGSGAVLAQNDCAATTLGLGGPGAVLTPATLYPPWAELIVREQGLPQAREHGYWRGEVALRGADGGEHAVAQMLEFQAAADGEEEGFILLATALADGEDYESALRFKRLFEEHPYPMWVYDLVTLRFLVVNAAAVRHYGYSEREFLGMTIRDIRPPDAVDKLLCDLARVPRAGAQHSTHWVHCKKDGTRIDVDISSHSVKIGGRAARFVFAHDVSARRRAELTLQLQGRAIEASVNAIVITAHRDGGDVIEYANPAFLQLSGYRGEDLAGRDLNVLLGAFPDAADSAALGAALQAVGEVTILLRNYHRDGTLFWNQLHVAPVSDAGGAVSHHVCVLNDLTAVMRYQDQLEHQANHDALTDLPNRNLFGDRLEQAIHYARRYAHTLWVVFIDLDNFKLVNDSLGHQLGDKLLCTVGARLRDCIRGSDTVARLGGDEFMLILLDSQQGKLSPQMLRDMLDAVAAPIHLDGQEVTITCSVGVSLYPDDGDDAQQLLKHADIAMYRAKDGGRNQVQFYAAAMHERISERTLIEAQLRHALARGELSLHYQPRVDLRSGQVMGMEALLRWRHPQLGMVAPARFIGVAEDTGLIVPIGLWVLQQACAQNRAWQLAGLAQMRVAVNLSARQFRDPGLADDIVRALAGAGLEARYLELELTESVMMQNIDAAVEALARLKALGIALSIDDFGTGYSSLAYLKLFPLDYLKIDRSFVQDMLGDASGAAIVRSVIGLGHSLGFKIIAEGVETAAQLAYLRGEGCDEIQGYYFSRPLPVDEFTQLLRLETALPCAEADEPGRRTLLLLDDEPNILAALARLFRTDGYTVLRADTPQQAFDLLALQPVQVIISDQRMPAMNGTEFFSRVKKIYPHTIRIILSGYTDIESVLNAINRGEIYRFYTKPWDGAALRENVREAFQYHQLLHGEKPR